MQSAFLQDADALIMNPEDLIKVLVHLRSCFPEIQRITSYARSGTIARIAQDDLDAMRKAGLTRLHVGLESGSEEVLRSVGKGVTQAQQIEAGIKVRKAGIELSEYMVPGLGGQALSREHAIETAEVLNAINPDFIRLRTLILFPRAPLYEAWQSGRFQKCTGAGIVAEIRRLIDRLDGIASTIASDLFFNLFSDLEGRLPADKARLLALLDEFLALDPYRQMLFEVGRRLGKLSSVREIEDAQCRASIEETRSRLGITPENVDDTLEDLIRNRRA
jgi:hypothetical protein